MNPAGIFVPVEPDGFSWERCPDLIGQPVIRRLSPRPSWMLWRSGFPDLKTSLWEPLCRDCRWRSVSLSLPFEDVEPLEVACSVSNSHGQRWLWLAVPLAALKSIDLLIERFGQPPLEVQRDWQNQLESNTAQPIRGSDLLSHLLVTSDGRLNSLASIEAIFLRSVPRSLEPTRLIPQLPSIDDACAMTAPTAGSRASVTLESFLRKGPRADSILRQPLLSRPHAKTKSNAGHPRPLESDIERKRHRGWIWISIATATSLLIGAFILLRPPRPLERTQNIPSIATSDTPPDDEWSTSSISPASTAEKTPDAITLLELAPNEPPVASDRLSDRASDSLQKLLNSMGEVESSDSVQSISFESVEAILKKTDESAVVQQSLAEAGSTAPNRMIASATPFAEPLEAGMTDTDSIIELEKAGLESSLEADPDPDQGYVVHSLAVQQSLTKTSLRVPFKPNDRSAICRARLRLAPDMLLKPVEAVSLAGRQDTMWSVAIKDDAASLSIYLRTKPAKAWYIATSVRLKMSPDVEIPIGPKDATRVRMRLQNYLRWLEQNRRLGESLRGNSKTRSMAIAGLDEIDKQSKATDKSLESWIEIEALVGAFYGQHAIELELASSAELLPVSK